MIDRLLSKRTRSRKSSSDSSTTSNISPEPKKQKGNEHAVGSEDKNLVAEEDDVSEDLHKTLHDIVKKLDKLDAIEKAVNSFQATLIKLESRIESLETSHADTKREVKEFKESLNFNEVERLRDTNFKMYQDLPLEIVERRRKQMDAFKKARGNNTPAFFSKAKQSQARQIVH